MRALVVLSFLVACDHRPPSETRAAPTQAVPAPAAVTADAGAAPLPVSTDDPCLKIGVNIAEIIIAATTDATQKAAYEQERAKMVKRFSENCTREKWPEATKACFLAAKTQQDIDGCSRELAKANSPPPPPPGAGTAAAPNAAGSGLKRD